MDERKVKRLVAAGELIRVRGGVKRMVFGNSSRHWEEMLVCSEGHWPVEPVRVVRRQYSYGDCFRLRSGLSVRQRFDFTAVGFSVGYDDELVLVAPLTVGSVIGGTVLYYDADPVRYGVVDLDSKIVCEQSKFWKSDRWCTYGPEDIGMLCLLDEVALCEMHAPMYLIHKSEVDQVF